MGFLRFPSVIHAAVVGAVLTSGCFHGRARGWGLFETAVVTALVVSALAPPPPRVIVVPAERPGYTWQPGYWTRQGDQWVWIDGTWVSTVPGARWVPTHWEQRPDGTWELLRGQWVPAPGY
jgi:YXWGXW repeat-containing protein